jgi:hypothetical protein
MLIRGITYQDGKRALDFIRDDGGRSAAGFKGYAGDCVARSIAIASEIPYKEVYERLAEGTGRQRASIRTAKRTRSARNGVNTDRKWFKNYMEEIGFVWTPCMHVGSGCKVHLLYDELPLGRLVVSLSKHYTAVIDRVIHDTDDPTRSYHEITPVGMKIIHRCVYGYWSKAA